MTHHIQKQFVIQQHTTPEGVHWDLMLEADNTLWTWRLNVPPAEMGDEPIGAERIADHRLRFLTYEGPVQSNTGQVRIADKGTYTENRVGTAHPTCLTLELHGTILNGTYTFIVLH
ncbi:MAG: DNA polymerase ligase N-terminal domain-containing protein [Planctomycetota bacterium]